MPRKPRVEYAGAVYHVMGRGNGGQPIYLDDADHRMHLKTIGEACDRCGWRVHAYVLMSNHFHLLLETPEPNLVAGMKWLQGTYTQRFNVRHQRKGHLFQGRYKAIPVQSDQAGYLETLASYIHLNPARARLLDHAKPDLLQYPWSSFPAYLHPNKRPPWLETGRLLEAMRLPDTPTGRNAFRLYAMKLLGEVLNPATLDYLDAQWKEIRHGWFLGTKEFQDQLTEMIGGSIGKKKRTSFSGEETKLHDERAAEWLLREGLKILNIDEATLLKGKKGSKEKCLLAWLVRQQTHVKNDWIAKRLQMGRPDCLSRYPKTIETTRNPRLLKLRAQLSKITKLRD